MNKIAFFINFLFLLTNNSIVFSQFTNIGIPEIRNFQKSDYDGGTQNWDIGQDSNGNIYFANNNGLYEFNGSFWTKYKIPNSDAVRSLKISKSGKIFVGGFNEFGYFFPNKNGKLTYHSLSDIINKDKSKQLDFVWKIHIINNMVVFQTFSGAYFYKNNKLFFVKPPSKFQFSFVVNNKLYFQDVNKGLLLYKNGNLIPVINSKLFESSEIWGMFSLTASDVLIATLDKGLFKLTDNVVAKFENESDTFVKKNSCLGGSLLKNGLIVLNSVLDGMIICDKSGNILQHINRKNGLQNNTVLNSFVDKENNIWLGLDNGISFVNQNSPFTFLGDSYNISSVYGSVTFNNRLYVATNQGVFYRKNNANFNDKFELVIGTTGQSWNLQIIDNQLFCSHNRGLFVIQDNKVIQSLVACGSWNCKQFPNDSNYMIASNYNGFAIFQKINNNWQLKNQIVGFSKSINNFEIDGNYLWFANDNLIYKLSISKDLKSFESTKIYKNLSINDVGIGSIQFFRNSIYFQTNNHFYNYNKINDAFVKDSTVTNLFSNIPKIKFAKEDNYGNIWYNYDESIGVLWNKKGVFSNNSSVFSSLTGNFVNNYFSINAVNSTQFFIGLTDGLAFFDANSKNFDIRPKVFVSKIVFPSEIIFASKYSNSQDAINVDFIDNNIKFSFSSPTYFNAKNLVFSYKLDGFDNKWSTWTTNNFKEYTNLIEGNYEMKVKSRNSFGMISNVESVDIAINAPWYRSFWAYLFYVALIFMAIYVIRLRIKAKIRMNKYYETIEQRKIYLEKESKIKQEQYELEKELEFLKSEKLKTDLISKDKELVNNSLQVVKKNKVLNEIISKIQEIDAEKLDDTSKIKFNKLNKSIEKEVNADKSWNDLEKHIKNVHFDFLKRLKEKHPTISPRELDLSTYLLMNMSTKEIAEIMNISGPGVELARYRLRKKLNLTKKENLTGFLMGI